MTTIFADAKTGVMVCDTKCTSDTEWFPMTKVFRVGDELIGLAGNVREATSWLRWYAEGKKSARPRGDGFAALILRKDGLFAVSSDGFEMLIERGFYGIGSGGGIAVGAFMAGAAAKKAVEIACNIDANSGGDVLVHKLKA
jgi:hypothetical protein